MHTSSLSPAELTGIDDRTLCVAATPREYYGPSSAVLQEVGRRGLDCRSLYTYTPNPVPAQPAQSTGSRPTICHQMNAGVGVPPMMICQ